MCMFPILVQALVARLPSRDDGSTMVEEATRLLALLPTAHDVLLQGIYCDQLTLVTRCHRCMVHHSPRSPLVHPCSTPPTAPAADLHTLVCYTSHMAIAQRLVDLRALLPTADVGVIIARHPSLAKRPLDVIEASLASIRAAMPNASTEFVDR